MHLSFTTRFAKAHWLAGLVGRALRLLVAWTRDCVEAVQSDREAARASAGR